MVLDCGKLSAFSDKQLKTNKVFKKVGLLQLIYSHCDIEHNLSYFSITQTKTRNIQPSSNLTAVKLQSSHCLVKRMGVHCNLWTLLSRVYKTTVSILFKKCQQLLVGACLCQFPVLIFECEASLYGCKTLRSDSLASVNTFKVYVGIYSFSTGKAFFLRLGKDWFICASTSSASLVLDVDV